MTALCAAAPAASWRSGLSGGGLEVCDGSGRAMSGWTAPADLTAAADALFLSESELAVVDHGYKPDEPLLSIAPWDDVGRGRLVAARRDGEPRMLASGLYCPMGVSLDGRGEPIVTEFERARIVDVSGAIRQAGYPGYLGQASQEPGTATCWPASRGGIR